MKGEGRGRERKGETNCRGGIEGEFPGKEKNGCAEVKSPITDGRELGGVTFQRENTGTAWQLMGVAWGWAGRQLVGRILRPALLRNVLGRKSGGGGVGPLERHGNVSPKPSECVRGKRCSEGGGGGNCSGASYGQPKGGHS